MNQNIQLCGRQLQFVIRSLKNDKNQIQHKQALIRLANNFVYLWESNPDPYCKQAVTLVKSFITVTVYNLEHNSVPII